MENKEKHAVYDSNLPQYMKDAYREMTKDGFAPEDHYARCRSCGKWVEKKKPDVHKLTTCYSCASSGSYNDAYGDDAFSEWRRG